MTHPGGLTETVHATCVVVNGVGVLLHGRSGSGKSDLALRLIDRGAVLVSDDYTHLRDDGGRLVATAPATIAGMIEVRGLGIVAMEHRETSPVELCVLLDEPVERMPPETFGRRSFAGIMIPAIALAALEPSAPIKVELAVRAILRGEMERR